MKTYRAEQRKEKSRLAAQIRRNRESQTLILLQNALPISPEVLGLHGLQVNSVDNLLSELFTSELEDCISTGLCELAPLGVDQSSTRSCAVNLEKSDLIRIAGHTLFFLNHINPHLGADPPATLSLKSRSVYGLVVNPAEKRIVYATPALIEVVGGSWVPLVGGLLRHLVQPLTSRSVATKKCTSSSKRKTFVEPLSDPENPLPSVFYAPQDPDPACLSGFVRLLKRRYSPADPLMSLMLEFENGTNAKRSEECSIGRRGKRRQNHGCRAKTICRYSASTSDTFNPTEWLSAGQHDEDTSLICHCWASAMLKVPTDSVMFVDETPFEDGGQPEGSSSSQPSGLSEDDSSTSNLETHQTKPQMTQLQLYLLRPLPLQVQMKLSPKSDPPLLAECIDSSGPSEHLDESWSPKPLVPEESHAGEKVKKQAAKKRRRGRPKGKPNELKSTAQPPSNDMLNHLLATDLSSLISPTESDRPTEMCFTRLDAELVVRELSESHPMFVDPEEEFTIVGQSFLSFIHPDDLEAVVGVLSKLTLGSMSWSPTYRVCHAANRRPGLQVGRYVWIRSLMTLDCDTQCFDCWHQMAGCESLSPLWIAFPEDRMIEEIQAEQSRPPAEIPGHTKNSSSIKPAQQISYFPLAVSKAPTESDQPFLPSLPAQTRSVQITQSDASSRWTVLLRPNEHTVTDQTHPINPALFGFPKADGRTSLWQAGRTTQYRYAPVTRQTTCHTVNSRARQHKTSCSKRKLPQYSQTCTSRESKMVRRRSPRILRDRLWPSHMTEWTAGFSPTHSRQLSRVQTTAEKYWTHGRIKDQYKFSRQSTAVKKHTYGSCASSVCSSPEEMSTNGGGNSYVEEQPPAATGCTLLLSPTLDELAQAALVSMVDDLIGSNGDLNYSAISPLTAVGQPPMTVRSQHL
ncbi:asparagine-rich antigen [Clonorchis sinensis]|uniref:Asparagine-rich antigen n=1 Tax=Clonorchis sinensis TaxID=79923 RepID=G7YV75_CLOSI|nr:asparagine-rich antigen [Clonorchis sinensis]